MKKVIILLLLPILAYGQSRFVRTVNNIDALIASNPSQIHTNVYVVGDTALAEGQVFTWVAGDATATNTTSVFASSVDPTGRWIRTMESGASPIITSYQSIGSGTDFTYNGATLTYEKIQFGTSGPGFTLTNAGTYQVMLNLAVFDSGTFNQDFWITNVTDNVSVPGSYRSISAFTSDHGLTLPIILQITVPSSKTFEVWGQTANVTYTSAGLIATNTVLNVIKLY